jgi:hypothetical protein
MLNGSMIPRSVRRMFDERAEPREEDSSAAEIELRGCRHKVRLSNLSSSGAMVIFPSMPHIGEPVVLHLSGRRRVPGQVCWVRDGRIGVNFAAAIE